MESSSAHVHFASGTRDPSDIRMAPATSRGRQRSVSLDIVEKVADMAHNGLRNRFDSWLAKTFAAPTGEAFESLESDMPPAYLSAIQTSIPGYLSSGEHITVATRPLWKRVMASVLILTIPSLLIFSILLYAIFGEHSGGTVIFLDFLLCYLIVCNVYIRCHTWLCATDKHRVVRVYPDWLASLTWGLIDHKTARVLSFICDGTRSSVDVKQDGEDGSGRIVFTLNSTTSGRIIVFRYTPQVERFKAAVTEVPEPTEAETQAQPQQDHSVSVDMSAVEPVATSRPSPVAEPAPSRDALNLIGDDEVDTHPLQMNGGPL